MGHLNEAAIAGISMTKQGDLSALDPAQVYWDVVEEALADAGLSLADVDGLIGNAPPGPGIRAALPGGALADQVGHPLRFHAATNIGAASPAAGVGLASLAIAHSMASVVVIPNISAGSGAGYGGIDRDEAVARMAQLGSPYEYLWGTTRVADYAVVARRHMHDYGTTEEQLAEIAVAQRYGATLNPLSVNGFRGEIAIDDVMASRKIAEPLKLLDCCLVNQGGGCIVVTRAADAALGSHAPVLVLGFGEGQSYLDPCKAPSLSGFEGGRLAADTAFSIAGIDRDEIDVAGISDHFTINVLVELEDAGFCKKGEGGAFVEGQRTRIGGSFPINTDGGFLSNSHAGSSGLFTVIELVRQIRHEAGPRQVEGARFAYSHGVGGVSQVQYAAVLGRG
jgi:acetyl-CoA acetyltransferase